MLPSLRIAPWAAGFAASVLVGIHATPPAAAQPAPARTPGEMIDGWEQLDLAAFAAEVDRVFAAPWPDQAVLDAVVSHGLELLSQAGAGAQLDPENMLALYADLTYGGSAEVDGETLASLQGYLATRQDSIDSFEQLKVARQAMAHAGAAEADRGSLLADWVDANGWQGLPAADRVLVLDELAYGGVIVDDFSVRWTGSLTPEVTGSYTFSRCGVPVCPADWMKVWINGQLVLDTQAAGDAGAASGASGGEQVAVALTAGQQVSIRVDYSRETDAGDVMAAWPIPCAMLDWSLDGGEPARIPGGVFSAPDGSPGSGLAASYYPNAGFEGASRDRVDPAIDWVWDDEWYGTTAADEHASTRRAVAASLLDAGVIDQLLADEAGKGQLLAAARTMTGSEREQFALMLMARPSAFAGVDGYTVKDLMWHLSAVSEPAMLDLLEAWCQAQPRYTTKIGAYPGWSWDGFLHLNYDRPAHMGRSLCGNWIREALTPGAVDLLLERGIARADGTPNIYLMMALINGCKFSPEHRVAMVGDLIATVLEDETLAGDTRAAWLVAQAILNEGGEADQIPNPLGGRRSLELAYAASVSDEMRFWVLGEHATRLASMGDAADLEALLAATTSGGAFNSEDQQAAIAYWRERALALSAEFEKGEDYQAIQRQQEVIVSLQSRLDAAIANNNAQGQTRYQRLLGQAEQALADLEQAFEAKWASGPE